MISGLVPPQFTTSYKVRVTTPRFLHWRSVQGGGGAIDEITVGRRCWREIAVLHLEFNIGGSTEDTFRNFLYLFKFDSWQGVSWFVSWFTVMKYACSWYYINSKNDNEGCGSCDDKDRNFTAIEKKWNMKRDIFGTFSFSRIQCELTTYC